MKADERADTAGAASGWRHEGGGRLDRALQAALPGYSRARLQRLIRAGAVTVDGRQWRQPGRRLRGGEWLRAELPAPAAPLAAQEMPLRWLYEDRLLGVLEKPAGLVVQPGAGRRAGTLVNALLARWPELGAFGGDPARAGIVHRLDKDTSGLLIVARAATAQAALQGQFAARLVRKRYLALTENSPAAESGALIHRLSRDPAQRHRFRARAAGSGVSNGKEAISEYRVLQGGLRGGRALLEVRPRSGRTHQIRAQLAHIGCPLVGDRVYGYRRQRLLPTRHFLHACALSFRHPASGQWLRFHSPLPPELAALLRRIGGEAPTP